MRILVTGATGYIGGRLVPALLAAGHQVRCLAREPAALDDRPWARDTEVVGGDALDHSSMVDAMAGVDAAYYLIHSMDGGPDFGDRDRRAAEVFRDAAATNEVGRIVYLGGLGDGDDLSPHLSSRQEVGAVMASGPTPVSELRAAVIIGSGSVSFEMVRYLTEVLPVMVTPRWVRTRFQPIAVRNILELLIAALDDPDPGHTIHEVGGPDVLTYEEAMQVYAREAGLRRRVILPVNVLTPTLSKHWIGLVTPLPTGVAKPLIESLRHEVVVTDNSWACQHTERLLPFREAVALALRRSEDRDVATRWSDAAGMPAAPQETDPAWSGGTVLGDHREVVADAAPADVFAAFMRIGGANGYYAFDWAWAIRGVIDSLVGGVGLRRGRRHPEELRVGESLDFWRVADIEPGRRLRLRAEMRLPGVATLEFEAVPSGDGTLLRQSARFVPRGLAGRLYWFVLVPFHSVIFPRMARRIAAAAEGRPVTTPTA